MRVLYVQYTNPGAYPPLVRGAQLLAEAGAEILMLGTRILGTNALDAPSANGVKVKLLAEAAGGWRLKAHYARYAAWVAREALSWTPDWIYASDLFATPIALGLANGQARVVYHEHDVPSADHQTWFVRRCLDARRRLLRSAAVVVAPNADRAARLSDLAGGRPVLTVWNCPRRPDHAPSAPRQPNGMRLIFRGSINNERLPLATIDALARVDAGVSLDVAGYETIGSRGYLTTFTDHAKRLGVAGRVRLLGAVSHADLAAVCEQCDVGLALMPMTSRDENMRHMVGASNKVFEYLASGVAPLVSDLPDWRRTFVDPGYALTCDPSDVGSIATALEWALAHRDAVQTIAERGRHRLQADWNYESQFAPVMDALLGPSATTLARVATREPARAPIEEAECAS
jgi:glycosyltransferase involved in cell wall biosynthesis